MGPASHLRTWFSKEGPLVFKRARCCADNHRRASIHTSQQYLYFLPDLARYYNLAAGAAAAFSAARALSIMTRVSVAASAR